MRTGICSCEWNEAPVEAGGQTWPPFLIARPGGGGANPSGESVRVSVIVPVIRATFPSTSMQPISATAHQSPGALRSIRTGASRLDESQTAPIVRFQARAPGPLEARAVGRSRPT